MTTQLWQVISDRGLIPFLEHHPGMTAQPPLSHDTDIGARFFQIRRALDSVADRLPVNVTVQSNMDGRFQMLVMLYSSHPFAAADLSCESAFGGDSRLCSPIVAEFRGLYGWSSQAGVDAESIEPARVQSQSTNKSSNFERVCSDLGLGILVQDTDAAWKVSGSWVWEVTPLYAAPMVRVIGCPRYFHRIDSATHP